ncbi:hypothetical protein CPB83DRAFT_856514 [Crepidotus variabilis]|uniref:Uncharacterized protein n=1 Tax=Crepidotus variabilis TaxID=179855 RepID=A0A9P6EDP5_9AGAR|nr:hypothetical protein CPB83DRAFT_856514 [Crepidotus variabilis]
MRVIRVRLRNRPMGSTCSCGRAQAAAPEPNNIDANHLCQERYTWVANCGLACPCYFRCGI